MPTETDWARLAAYIDGEGCIDLHLHRQFREHLNRVYERRYLRITMVNTDPRLSAWLKATFGGCDYKEVERKNKNWSRQWAWYVQAAKAADCLRNCLPYFVMKRDQAEVALAFQETVDSAHNTGRGGLAPGTLERREELAADLKRLKRSYKQFRAPELEARVH
jgi:hypothetical protein